LATVARPQSTTTGGEQFGRWARSSLIARTFVAGSANICRRRDVLVRLATVVSLIAAVIAILLRTLTDVSEPAVVVVVMIVAFGLSWHATWHDA
jgi:hypothetical protein